MNYIEVRSIVMSIKNEIMLITYADSIGKDLKDLNFVLETYLNNIVGGYIFYLFILLQQIEDLHLWNIIK